MNATGSPTQNPRHLRVFLASPGDVADERDLALKVLEQLQYDPLLRGRITLETVAWDKLGAGTPMLATMTPQEAIKKGLPTPAQCDIVIVIFWSRMGTPLPADRKKPDGSGYLSGTEWEYLNALEAADSQGKPGVLVYRRTEKQTLDQDDPQFDEKRKQWWLVQQFFHSFENPDGSLRRGYNPYPTPDAFREQLNLHLRALVRELLEREAPVTTVQPAPPAPPAADPPPLWSGSPFPGLRAFIPADASIFFGRGRETDDLVSRLGDPTLRFLTVVGASGSGKSSLVAAGLIPRLLAGAVAGSQDWTWVRFTPGEVGDNPFMALAMLFKDALQQQGQQPRELADRLEKNPVALVEWRDLALIGKPDWAELLLFIDQFEELFTLVATDHAKPFIEWLHQAAQTDRIRVVATLRADFYHRCVEQSVLAQLFTGSYNLAAPGWRALGEMITRPAERAGLTFENGLAECILDDTGAEPGALALLAFALAELYNARTADGRLTWADYTGFNGVQGAIAKRAEDTFNKLDADAQVALSDIFRELVEVDERGVATRRRAARHQVSRSVEAAERLIDRFTDARLLVTSGKDEPTVEVAHEALLRSWPWLANWIESVRDDLHWRSQLQRDAITWKTHGYGDKYRWKDERVVETCGMLKRLCYRPSELEQSFLDPIDPEEMIRLLNDLATPAELRGTIGVRLALFGDPRPGVGLGAAGPLDFCWASIPGAKAVRASGQFPNFSGFRLGNGAKPDEQADNNENWPENSNSLEIVDFKLTTYLVTVAQFRPFVEQNGYQEERYWSKTGWRIRGEEPDYWKNMSWTLLNHPVLGVNWYAAEAYCNWLSERLGLSQGVIRLPTEAEWEWAARGPDGKRYPWGDDWKARHCNSLEEGLNRTTAVGCFPAGAANWWQVICPGSSVVHDLAGNVWEWTASEYTEDYAGAHQSVQNADAGGKNRVFRGGSYTYGQDGVRGAKRIEYISQQRPQTGSFRLARDFPLNL